MRAAIVGLGNMGAAIAYAMDKLGFDITAMDNRLTVSSDVPEGEDNRFMVVDDLKFSLEQLAAFKRPEVLISSLPYNQTEEVGLWCIENSVRYCDLGGKVSVSKRINDAGNASHPSSRSVFTDLGLAPGWVNILAEHGYRQLHSNGGDLSVKMMVGGLPDYLESAGNPLRYATTWSVEGLINEYKDDCIIIEDGFVKTVRGMDGLETVKTDSLGKLEAFYTSGGASHSIASMKERGVKNCSYKTLRYDGHCEIIRFLIRECGLSDDTLTKIFAGCGKAEKDEVIIVAEVSKGNSSWREEKIIKSDKRFSAMQKATAFPIASVAAIMAEGKMEGDKEQRRDYWTTYPKALTYADVPFEDFTNNLKTLGLDG